MTTITDDRTGMRRTFYRPLTPEQLAAEQADFKRRVFQVDFDIHADRQARHAAQETKEFRSSRRQDQRPDVESGVDRIQRLLDEAA